MRTRTLSLVVVLSAACGPTREPPVKDAGPPEVEDFGFAPNLLDRTDAVHPWFMYPEYAEETLPAGYDEPEASNPALEARIASLQLHVRTYAGMRYDAFAVTGAPCPPMGTCLPVAKIVLDERNMPASLRAAGHKGPLTALVFRDQDPAEPGTVLTVYARELANAAGELTAIPLEANEPLQVQIAATSLERYPADMPAIHYPVFGCKEGDLGKAHTAWARAHYLVWRGYQLMEFLGGAGGCRDTYWSDGYRAADGDANWSPRNWFGEYAGYRFDATRKVVKKTWERFRNAEVAGTDLVLDCVNAGQKGNPCFNTNPGTDDTPAAYHFPIGRLHVCPKMFAGDRTTEERAKLLVHEMMHHTNATWREGDFWRSDVVDDVHFHGGHDGKLCSTGGHEKMYGPERAMHLSQRVSCNHADKAFRNCDNYAWYFHRLGSAVLSGALVTFPTGGPCWQSPPSNGNECTQAQHPPPPDPYTDPVGGCQKLGQAKVCEGGGSGGGGVVQPQCLAVPP